MSISYVEFQKLLNPAVPEKFKLLYEILYYYKIDIAELLGLTTDRVIYDETQEKILQGIKLRNGKLIELPSELFERIVNFLEFNNKPWGNQQSFVNKDVNKKNTLVFESNKKGHEYTIPTLYKKFKEHCLKVGILRDLALGSLINTDLGRFVSIINAELSNANDKLVITVFSIGSEEISSLLRYYIVHLNYEEITNYRKEKVNYGLKEVFIYPFVEINSFTLLNIVEEQDFQFEIERSRAIYVYTQPTSKTKIFNITLIQKVHEMAENKFVSFIIDDPQLVVQDSIEQILSKEFRPWVQYVPIHMNELQNHEILSYLEDFFMFLLEKFNSHTHDIDIQNPEVEFK